MPVYVFRCPECHGLTEQLLRLGDTGPRPCPVEGCGGTATLKVSRVAVKYDSWGFTHTDNLVSDPKGKDFKTLRDKASEIADS